MILLGSAALSLAGCSATVPVEADFPTLTVSTLPAEVGIHYDKSFSDYVHKEQKPRSYRWTIHLGPAQVALFDEILTAMFEHTVMLSDSKAEAWRATEVAGVVSPMVETYHFETPQQTGVEFFEVWIHYRMRLYLPDGKLIANWRFTAYGKSPSQGRKAVAPLNDATVAALRDAAAVVAVNFPTEPDVKAWLALMNVETEPEEEKTDVAHREYEIPGS